MAEPRRLTIADLKPDLREVHPVRWPGGEREVGLLLLRDGEVREAYFAARDYFRKKGYPAFEETAAAEFDRELGLQVCFRMLIDPEARVPEARIFDSPEEARRLLDPDERSLFVAEHVRLQTARAAAWAAERRGGEQDEPGEQNEESEPA